MKMWTFFVVLCEISVGVYSLAIPVQNVQQRFSRQIDQNRGRPQRPQSEDGLIDEGQLLSINKNKPKIPASPIQQQIQPQPTKGSVSRPNKGTRDEEHEKGEGFEFEYGVDDQRGNTHSHQQSSDGDVVKGQYQTQLTDGTTMIVSYVASWKSGFRVKYIKYTSKIVNLKSKTNSFIQ